jgi:ketosteroid isomerase-like protein
MRIFGGFTRALAVVAFVAAAAPASADSAAELKALMAVDKGWESAYARRDADALASFYDENAVLLPPGAPPVKGRAAIRAYFANDVAEAAKAGISFVLGPDPQGGISGYFGWASGTYVAKDKTGKVVETGKYLSVSQKKGGKWLYVRDTWNSDGTPAPAVPAKK